MNDTLGNQARSFMASARGSSWELPTEATPARHQGRRRPVPPPVGAACTRERPDRSATRSAAVSRRPARRPVRRRRRPPSYRARLPGMVRICSGGATRCRQSSSNRAPYSAIAPHSARGEQRVVSYLVLFATAAAHFSSIAAAGTRTATRSSSTTRSRRSTSRPRTAAGLPFTSISTSSSPARLGLGMLPDRAPACTSTSAA